MKTRSRGLGSFGLSLVTLRGTGWSVFEPVEDPSAKGGGEGGDVTMHQIITHSAEHKWWLRIPTHTGWLEIDFQ